MSNAMNGPPEIPPVIRRNRAITYELTRWDLVVSFVTVLFRNRVARVIFPAFLVINGAIILGPGLSTRPFAHTVFGALAFLIGFTGLMLVGLSLVGLAIAFLLKQRGVVGQHVLEITQQGLIERTEFNEGLHKWGSICRITSMCGYLFIYVSDMNSHQVPKRGLSVQELSEFEEDLRARANQAKSQ